MMQTTLMDFVLISIRLYVTCAVKLKTPELPVLAGRAATVPSARAMPIATKKESVSATQTSIPTQTVVPSLATAIQSAMAVLAHTQQTV